MCKGKTSQYKLAYRGHWGSIPVFPFMVEWLADFVHCCGNHNLYGEKYCKYVIRLKTNVETEEDCSKVSVGFM